MKIKKGDNVIVLKGKDRGKKGKVQQVLPKEGKLVVEGMNVRKKHIKAKRAGEKGQVVHMAGFMASSNVALICPKCSKPARTGFTMQGLKKYRSCKNCKAIIDI
ncbi:MAG: 50S ribosomal protein L24 [Candidatus Wildermuthbacteria bacterium]|nr:50S ribosomal protein L24 [Candidatus Wildermuthbacteria bacterium]